MQERLDREQPGEQRYKNHTNNGYTSASHELLHALRLVASHCGKKCGCGPHCAVPDQSVHSEFGGSSGISKHPHHQCVKRKFESVHFNLADPYSAGQSYPYVVSKVRIYFKSKRDAVISFSPKKQSNAEIIPHPPSKNVFLSSSIFSILFPRN